MTDPFLLMYSMVETLVMYLWQCLASVALPAVSNDDMGTELTLTPLL